MKTKNKAILISILIVLSCIILYPIIGKKLIEKDVHAYLYKDGYNSLDIAKIEVRHNYINGLLGYGMWHTSIYFIDELKVEYHCLLTDDIIPKVIGIKAGGFSVSLPNNYLPQHYPS